MTQNTIKGALLLNLGTPDAPEAGAVRRYLEPFLMDPYVLDMPFLLRWMVVHWGILPKRPRIAAEAYRKVWTASGSPLLVHLRELARQVKQELGDAWNLQYAMRYGNPSLEKAFQEFRENGVKEVTLLPLYPQYSLSANESSIQAVMRCAQQGEAPIKIRVVEPFYQKKEFIDPFVQVARKNLGGFDYDHILFSFHGLPERHIRKTDRSGEFCEFSQECCREIRFVNRDCYRAHCFATARRMASGLGIPQDQYTVCFQSRLGRTPWIQPFTDELYRTLPTKGVRKVAVLCPSFVADCLETLEEVQIRGREEFVRSGGQDLRMIPSLNSDPLWAKGVAALIQEN